MNYGKNTWSREEIARRSITMRVNGEYLIADVCQEARERKLSDFVDMSSGSLFLIINNLDEMFVSSDCGDTWARLPQPTPTHDHQTVSSQSRSSLNPRIMASFGADQPKPAGWAVPGI